MYTMLNHLYKSTAAVALAAFIILGVGLTTGNKPNVEATANTPTSALTLMPGTTPNYWIASTTSISRPADGKTQTYPYKFITGNLTVGTPAATQIKLNTGATGNLRGYLANVAAVGGVNYDFATITSIVVDLQVATTPNIEAWFNSTPMTNLATPGGTAATVTGTNPYTITPTGGTPNAYFLLRNANTSTARNVKSVVINFVPKLASIALSGSYATSFNVGATFNRTNMVVTGTYEDTQTSVETGATSDYDGKVFANADVGTGKVVTVTFTENAVPKTATYTIAVAYPVGDNTVAQNYATNFLSTTASYCTTLDGVNVPWSTLKTNYNALTGSQKDYFYYNSTGDIPAAKARYQFLINKYPTLKADNFIMNSSGVVLYAANPNAIVPAVTETNAFMNIVLISLAGITAMGAYFLIGRKRKED